MIVRRLSFNCSLPSFFIKYRVIFKFLSLKIPKLGNNLFFSKMFLCRVQHFFILEFIFENICHDNRYTTSLFIDFTEIL